MLWTFCWFELKLRLRSISTYIFFLIPFLMMFFSVSVRTLAPSVLGKFFSMVHTLSFKISPS